MCTCKICVHICLIFYFKYFWHVKTKLKYFKLKSNSIIKLFCFSKVFYNAATRAYIESDITMLHVRLSRIKKREFWLLFLHERVIGVCQTNAVYRHEATSAHRSFPVPKRAVRVLAKKMRKKAATGGTQKSESSRSASDTAADYECIVRRINNGRTTGYMCVCVYTAKPIASRSDFRFFFKFCFRPRAKRAFVVSRFFFRHQITHRFLHIWNDR